MKTVSLVLVLAGLYLAGCNRQSEKASSPATSENGWPAVRDALIEDYLKAHPAFAVSGYDELIGRLRAAGVPVTDDASIPGVRRCYVTDPWENRVELVAVENGA